MDATHKQTSIPRARIFLVEDEILVLEDLKAQLIRKNYEIVGTATSGNDAIEGIKLSNPDLVIMDVRIKGEMNGIEVAIIIQSHFDHPPALIFLTGFSEKTFAYLKVLPDYIYLNKPFEEKDLSEAVERAVTKRKQDATLE